MTDCSSQAEPQETLPVVTKQQKKEPVNILKVRDDAELICFSNSEDPEEKDEFILHEDSSAPWLGGQQEFGHKELRSRIEPWLTALFQSEHLSLLAGSGLMHAVHYIAAGGPAAGMDKIPFETQGEKIDIAAKLSSEAAKRKEGNIEDQLRVANELLRGLEILNDPQAEQLKEELESGMQNFAQSILQSEAGIIKASEEQKKLAFNTLVTFLMSFASRTGVRDRLNIFTTNYDRLIEAGAELAGIHLMDRFLGNLMPVFRSSRLDLDMHYSTPGIRGEPRYLEGVARFTKLHGSVDWLQANHDIRRMGLPFGAPSIKPFLQASGSTASTAHKLMIYPNAAKDQETANYPYVELFRDLAAAICQPNSTLVTYGYSFGDDHINRVIRDMLTIPSTHLVIISRDDAMGRIMGMYESLGRNSQISLLIGPALADITNLTKYYLPKSAIDKTTSRMSELLKQRFTTNEQPPNAASEDNNPEVSFI